MATAVFLSPRPVLGADVADEPAGRLLTGASVALRVMQVAKQPSWRRLQESGLPDNVRITPHQARCMQEAGEVLGMLRAPAKGQGAVCTVAVCLECSQWMVVADSSVPGKCPLGVGCSGKLVKASPAVSRKPLELAKAPV